MSCSPPPSSLLASAVCALASAVHAQDFNGNGTRDSVDLRSGTSQDLDHDGIPDEVALRRLPCMRASAAVPPSSSA